MTELFRTLRAPLAPDASALDELRHKLAAAVVTSYSMGSNLQHWVRPSSFPQEAGYERLVSLLRPK